ncbi:hypothetical protein BHE74_00044479 [Ensete ventricosum]|uniref:Translation initiation factor eIF2B subunit beta n=1 Tax=Ensete ventricosum TaxID=4639 RepID=A0A426ZWZ5_ENSVE|nr:hypothetical protein B296_00020561 [Ensete ventricosum]RWW49374.1 hypothetical protein BHE74_00044479 [Ensete ventricosum]RZS27231.1 hypothetical protein BHM03_00060668 [Ensete ventricosum]
MEGLGLTAGSDDDEGEHEDRPGLSAAAVAAAARSTLRAPSLQTLLEDIPESVVAPHPSSSGGDSEGKSKSDRSSRSKKLKHDVIEAINELIQDIDTCHELISEQAVIVGAHAIMANGGVIAPVGINMVALAAQRHAVPFVVVAGSHKVHTYRAVLSS